jgi:nicotinamidase-related amidase
VIVAGQAKSHCVAWSVHDLLSEIRARDPELAGKVFLLEDCTSSVVVPGVVDFTEQADGAFKQFAEAGMHRVHSTDPIDSWPELSL